MVTVLIFIAALALIAQAFIGLTYFISCIREKEKQATFFAGLQFVGMLGLVVFFFFLIWIGFFETVPGLSLLIAGLILGALGAFLLMRRTGANQRALEGSKGLIVGKVKRYDEREIVFARNRSLRPGSEQYRVFYKEHPEYEEFDARRRKMGGPLGHPGTIDRPYEGPNVAATLSSVSIPLHLSAPDKVKSQPYPELRGKKANLSPGEATERLKGYALSLGADLVGITEVNPLWIYSHRGEIFYENWEDWGKEIEAEHK